MQYRPKKSEAQKKIERDERIIERKRIAWEKWHKENGIKESDALTPAQQAILNKLESGD